MKIWKTHKNIKKIDKHIGNMRITSQGYVDYTKGKREEYTNVSCWYDCNCENCPMGLYLMSYEGECEDCGCLFDYNFKVPIWKCMLPKWLKRKIRKHIVKKRRLDL